MTTENICASNVDDCSVRDIARQHISIAHNDIVRHRAMFVRRLCAILIVALTLGLAGTGNTANYPLVWQPLGVGCARAISVGPNGVPWILGCSNGDPNGVGPAWVYYLNTSLPPGSLLPHYQWIYDNFSALTLYVNVNGVPYATDTNGNVYSEYYNNADQNPTYLMLPSGVWVPIAAGNPVSSIAASTSVTLIPGWRTGEMFYPAQPYYPRPIPPGSDGTTNLWGISCYINCYNGIWKDDTGIWYMQYIPYPESEPIMTPWAEAGGSASATTMFTVPSGTSPYGTDIVQIPWVLNSGGNLYRWSADDNFGEQGSWIEYRRPRQLGRSPTARYWVDPVSFTSARQATSSMRFVRPVRRVRRSNGRLWRRHT